MRADLSQTKIISYNMFHEENLSLVGPDLFSALGRGPGRGRGGGGGEGGRGRRGGEDTSHASFPSFQSTENLRFFPFFFAF